MAKTKEDRIKTVYGGGGHVVILGAGASITSTFRNPEQTGKRLPPKPMEEPYYIHLVSNTHTTGNLKQEYICYLFLYIDAELTQKLALNKTQQNQHFHHLSGLFP